MALIAVIEEDGLRLQSQKVAEFIGKGSSTVRRSLDLLTDKEILREQQLKGGVQLRFEDPFFSQWIRALPANVTGFSLTQMK
jgi:hypothetical protein